MIVSMILAAVLAADTPVAPLTVTPRGPPDATVMRGRDLVRRQCVGCHSVQSRGLSIYTHAPPFRWMTDLDPQVLRLVAAQVAQGDHYAMPAVVLTPSDSEDIAAFIRAFANGDRATQKRLSLPPCVGRTC